MLDLRSMIGEFVWFSDRNQAQRTGQIVHQYRKGKKKGKLRVRVTGWGTHITLHPDEVQEVISLG